jgi:hypothetical protein
MSFRYGCPHIISLLKYSQEKVSEKKGRRTSTFSEILHTYIFISPFNLTSAMLLLAFNLKIVHSAHA